MQNMRNDAYEELKHRILHFEYLPGTKISEKNLAEDLNLGRTPVREAIIRIERDGLIEVIPQSGTYITKINLSDAENARFTRESIEKSVVLEAIVSTDKSLQKRIKRNLVAQADAIEAQDADEFFNLDEQFHETFYEMANRKSVWNWLQSINMQLNRFRWLRLKVTDLQWDTIIEQHRAIFEAVENKSLEDTSFLVDQHLRLMLSEKKALLETYPEYFDIEVDSNE